MEYIGEYGKFKYFLDINWCKFIVYEQDLQLQHMGGFRVVDVSKKESEVREMLIDGIIQALNNAMISTERSMMSLMEKLLADGGTDVEKRLKELRSSFER